MDERAGRQDPYIRTVAVDSPEAKKSSVWFNFKDGSGYLKRFSAQEGVYLPLASEIGGFFISVLTFQHHFSSHWTTSYIYLFNNKDECSLGLAMSSPYQSQLTTLIKEIEWYLSDIESDEEEEYYEEEEYEDEEEI